MKMYRPMAVLLMFEAYPPAILAAVVLHAALIYLIIDKGVLADKYVDLDKPVYIPATIVDVNPQKLRKLEQLELQRQSDLKTTQRRKEEAAAAERAQEALRVKERETAEKAEAARQERIVAEKRNKEEAAAKELEQARIRERDREKERERQRENERLAQEHALREAEEARQATALREAEAQRQAQAQQQADQAASDNQNVSAYMAVIHDALARNWSVPPSARNGMLVVLELKLVPTGEVIDYYIGLSSGDAAFDRSALQAVGRVQRFPELQDMPNRIFETNFRTLTIRFRPEDLLR